MAIFEGAGVALVTPFAKTGEINYEKLEELVEEQIAGGTDCIVAMGTTGESATTTEEEHLQAIRFICQAVKGRAPVIAGTGSNCTRTAVELSVEAQEAGADGVLLVSPYYNKATQKGLKAHFTAVAEAIKIPAILYNIPSRTGVNIAPETIAELCRDVKNIVGVKEASGDFRYVPNERAEVFEVTGGDGVFYDYTTTPPISTTPSTFRYGDIFAINFEASGQELEGTEDVYLCAKAVLADGTERIMEDKVDKSLMEKSGETSYFRYIYPYDFFGLPVGTEIKEIYVWCSNADGSVLYKEGEDGTLVSQAEQ